MIETAPVSAFEFHLDESQCVGCAICVDVCPHQALAMSRGDLLPAWVAGLCTGCALCEQECPTAAIAVVRPVGLTA